MKTRDGVVDDARGRIADLLTRLVPEGPVALLDCPSHTNVGDSAIWLGEREALRAVGRGPPVYTCTVRSFEASELRRRMPAGTILLSGGGNFGDLYPEIQRFRERVVRQFPEHRVVVLPQSIHFRERRALERARRVLEAHPDLHLAVRTRRSLDLAREHFDVPVELCPDMAFALGPLPRTGSVETERLYLLRRDDESRGRDDRRPTPGEGERVTDWGGGYREPDSLAALTHYVAWRWSGRGGGGHLRALTDYAGSAWTRRAWCRVAAGIRILSRSRVVVTDRLHGHILAFLLGIPHVAVDNSYGKVHAYVRTWTGDSGLIRMAADLAEARARAEQLAPDGELARPPGRRSPGANGGSAQRAGFVATGRRERPEA